MGTMKMFSFSIMKSKVELPLLVYVALMGESGILEPFLTSKILVDQQGKKKNTVRWRKVEKIFKS